MIIWINGAFGSGKSTAAYELQRRLPGSYVYDPEEAGFYIRKQLPQGIHKDDFQDYEMWRDINYRMLKYVSDHYSGSVIVPMTIVNPKYYQEIVGRLQLDGVEVRHFALWASRDVLIRRLKSRWEGKNSWAAQQIDRCLEGLSHEVFHEHLATDHMSIGEVVDTIAAKCGLSLLPDSRTALRRQFDRALSKWKQIRW